MRTAMNTQPALDKLATHIHGFDAIAAGGLPAGRTTLVSGTAGSAKTIFAAQFLAEGIRSAGQNGVFVTFEESPNDIRRNMIGLGWDIVTWEDEDKWIFVDASLKPGEADIVTGQYDLGALLARIEFAITKVDARRVVLDSLGSILNQFADAALIRGELFRVTSALKLMDVTAVLTSERTGDKDSLSRFGVEEFVADSVIILRNAPVAHKRRRTLEIFKFRGADHQKGEFPFTIRHGEGIVVIPPASAESKQKATDARISSGNRELDQMCAGGFFRDSLILVSGATGIGKTLMVSEFMAGGAAIGENTVLFTFEESREQLIRNAKSLGVDFERMEQEGWLKIVARHPDSAGLEDHLVIMKEIIDEFQPKRVAVDSLSALERASTTEFFREFVIRLSSYIRGKGITGMFTASTTLLGGASITKADISTFTDLIILLRYVEMYGEIRRGITVLKMRGSKHDKGIREFTVGDSGMQIGEAFRNISGILSGNAVRAASGEIDRMADLFQET